MAQYSREYIAMLLSSFMYLDTTGVNFDGKDTLGELIPKIIEDDGSGEYQVLLDALQKDTNGEIRNLTVRDVSWQEGGEFANTGACMIENPVTGEKYVVYRGTQDGEWVDNGAAMADVNSEQQRNASAYLDHLAEKYGWDESEQVIVTGHSKGGNKAQFVTLDAEHRNVIDESYSFDGQGFSPEAIEYYKRNLGEDYEKALRKLHGVSGENDYVHPLGIQIIPEDQCRYLKQDEKMNPLEYHYACNLFTETDGRYTAAPMEEAGQEGRFARTVRRTSEYLMELDRNEREDAAKSVMQIIDVLNGGRMIGFHGEEGFTNIIPFLKNTALPAVVVIASAWVMEGLPDDIWKQIRSTLEKIKIVSPVGLVITSNFLIPLLPYSETAIRVVEYVYDFVSEKIMTPVISCFIKCYEQFTSLVKDFTEWVKQRKTGGRISSAEYEIRMSVVEGQTEYLLGCASETERIKDSLIQMRKQTEGILKVYPILQYYFRRAEFKLERCGGQIEKMGTGLAYICEIYRNTETRIAEGYEGI